MTSRPLAQTALAVTGGIAALSVAMRVASEPDGASTTAVDAAVEMAHRAIQWRETATQDTDPALRLQHAATAATLFQAARTLVSDDALERRLGHDVARLSRTLDRRLIEARQSVGARVRAEALAD